MRIGVCAPLSRLEEAKALGFDYLEANVTDIGRMSDAEFADAAAAVRASGFPVLRANCLFPGEITLTAEDSAADVIDRWLQRALPRVKALGAEIVVFGSGASRRRPDSMPYAVALRRLARVARQVGEVCRANGLRAAIEPLNPGETNMILSLAEGACLAAMADHPCVGLLADAYHIALTGEPADDLLRLGGVWHVHVALKDGRRWPAEEDADLRAFLRALLASGYDGCVSIEGRSDDWSTDAAKALPLLRAWTERL